MTAEIFQWVESGFMIYRPECKPCEWIGPKTHDKDWAISHMTVHNNMCHKEW